jgi:osmotically-inducible protein OsmY
MSSEIYTTRDEEIQEAVEGAISAWMPPKAPPIDVAVQGATVTLTGYVANEAMKEGVIKKAYGVEGVINVIDNLEVGGGHPWKDWFFPWRNPNEDLVREDDRGEI